MSAENLLEGFDWHTAEVFASGTRSVRVRDLIAGFTGGDPARLLALAEALASERIERRIDVAHLSETCPGYAEVAAILHLLAAAHHERDLFILEASSDTARLMGLDPEQMTLGELRDELGGEAA